MSYEFQDENVHGNKNSIVISQIITDMPYKPPFSLAQELANSFNGWPDNMPTDSVPMLRTMCLTDTLPNDNMPTGHLAYRTQCLQTFCLLDIILFLRKQKNFFLFNFIYFQIFTPYNFYTLISCPT